VGPGWNWIGYINSFDDENSNGGGNGCGCVSVLTTLCVTVVFLALLNKISHVYSGWRPQNG
jgi:hypothetical protein